jgi:hypothetical protein
MPIRAKVINEEGRKEGWKEWNGLRKRNETKQIHIETFLLIYIFGFLVLGT